LYNLNFKDGIKIPGHSTSVITGSWCILKVCAVQHSLLFSKNVQFQPVWISNKYGLLYMNKSKYIQKIKFMKGKKVQKYINLPFIL